MSNQESFGPVAQNNDSTMSGRSIGGDLLMVVSKSPFKLRKHLAWEFAGSVLADLSEPDINHREYLAGLIERLLCEVPDCGA